MADSTGSTESAFADLLAGLWNEFEDLLDAFHGRRSVEPGGGDRLRMKLYGIRERLEQMLAAEPPQPGSMVVTAPQRLAVDLLRLLDTECLEDDFDLACGPTIVRAQNRILDAAQRLALAS